MISQFVSIYLLLYSLFIHDCMVRHNSNTIIKFVDDTAVVCLITDDDETAYREEVSDLALWCQDNKLSLNVSKTKELIMELTTRNGRPSMPSFTSMGL